MAPDRLPAVIRDLATLGLAVAGVAALLSGLALLAAFTVGRAHPLLVLTFLGSASLAGLSGAALLVSGARSAARDPGDPNGG